MPGKGLKPAGGGCAVVVVKARNAPRARVTPGVARRGRSRVSLAQKLHVELVAKAFYFSLGRRGLPSSTTITSNLSRG